MAEPIDSEAPSKSNAKWLWLALIVLFAVLAIIWIADPTTPVEEVTDQNVPAAASDAERQKTILLKRHQPHKAMRRPRNNMRMEGARLPSRHSLAKFR